MDEQDWVKMFEDCRTQQQNAVFFMIDMKIKTKKHFWFLINWLKKWFKKIIFLFRYWDMKFFSYRWLITAPPPYISIFIYLLFSFLSKNELKFCLYLDLGNNWKNWTVSKLSFHELKELLLSTVQFQVGVQEYKDCNAPISVIGLTPRFYAHNFLNIFSLFFLPYLFLNFWIKSQSNHRISKYLPNPFATSRM